MIRRSQRIIVMINMITDLLITFLSYFLAIHIRYNLMRGRMRVDLFSGQFIVTALVYSVFIILLYRSQHLYSTNRVRRRGSEFFIIFLLNAIGTMALMSSFYVVHVNYFSRMALGFFWLLTSVIVSVKRLSLRMFLDRYRAKGGNLVHVAIVGDGAMAYQYLQDLKDHSHMGIKIDGYISAVEKPDLGKRLGRYEDIEQIIEKYNLDELVVALEPHEMVFLRYILGAAEKEGIRINLIPFYNDLYPAHPTIETIGKTKLIDLRATPLDNVGWSMVKRSMDIIGSLLMIILSSPIMLFVAIGVKLSSPGPILFKQERVGVNKKPFKMLKFRSMRVDIDHTGWSTDEDPRKTRFGSFIRKFSLDELPQAFNVLVGQMSLVGPRPEIPRYVRQFKEEVPLYLVRQQVRPGITGWAQVHGLRGDTSIEARVEYDIWYIENWSIALDIQILLKTIFGGMVNQEVLIPKKEPKTKSKKSGTDEDAASSEKEEN